MLFSSTLHWIERAPIVVIGIALLAGLLIAHELAFRLGQHMPGEGRGEARGYLVSSALALLGLLMAFTFSAAQDRFRLRQDLVVAEANALGTSYLRFQLLDPPWRDQLSRELLGYAETRVGFARALTPADVEANAGQSAVLQQRIWRDLALAVRANSVPTLNLALVNSLNETFDLAATSRAAREARVPVTVLRVLLFCSFTVAAIVGYTEGVDRRHTGVLVGVLLLLTVAFCLILDLDRPISGSVRISHSPMQRALDDIRRGEAAKAQLAAPPSPAGR